MAQRRKGASATDRLIAAPRSGEEPSRADTDPARGAEAGIGLLGMPPAEIVAVGAGNIVSEADLAGMPAGGSMPASTEGASGGGGDAPASGSSVTTGGSSQQGALSGLSGEWELNIRLRGRTGEL